MIIWPVDVQTLKHVQFIQLTSIFILPAIKPRDFKVSNLEPDLKELLHNYIDFFEQRHKLHIHVSALNNQTFNTILEK